MATKKELLEILAFLAAAFPRFELTEATITVYINLLEDLPADELRAAAKQCATGDDFFPSVHELREAVAELWRAKQRIPNAFEAWKELLEHPKDGYQTRAIEEGGQNIIEKTAISWSHPLVERVARQMGWPAFPTSDEIGVDRAHFYRAYEYALNKAMRDSVQLPEVRAYIEAGSISIQSVIENIKQKTKVGP